MEAKITITFETDALATYTDQHLATLWHVAQANPIDGFDSPGPGLLAEKIGREIIRRFVSRIPPELWKHQGHHFKNRPTT